MSSILADNSLPFLLVLGMGVFVLFIPFKMIELGRWAFIGRGLPIGSTKRRLSGLPGKIVGGALILTGVACIIGYVAWGLIQVFFAQTHR